MAAKTRIIVEHNGETWTPRKLAERLGMSVQWAAHKLKLVLSGKLDMDDVLNQSESSRMPGNPAKIYRIVVNGVEEVVTAKDVMKRAGIHETTAGHRLKAIMAGKRDPGTLFNPSRIRRPRDYEPSRRRFPSLDECEPENYKTLPADRRENYEELKRASFGEINQNEWLYG